MPLGIPIPIPSQLLSVQKTKRISRKSEKEETEYQERQDTLKMAPHGEENLGFLNESEPRHLPLPDLLVDLCDYSCSYNAGRERVTFQQRSDLGKECKEELVSKRKIKMAKKNELLELLVLGKQEEPAFTWSRTNIKISRGNVNLTL